MQLCLNGHMAWNGKMALGQYSSHLSPVQSFHFRKVEKIPSPSLELLNGINKYTPRISLVLKAPGSNFINSTWKYEAIKFCLGLRSPCGLLDSNVGLLCPWAPPCPILQETGPNKQAMWVQPILSPGVMLQTFSHVHFSTWSKGLDILTLSSSHTKFCDNHHNTQCLSQNTTCVANN